MEIPIDSTQWVITPAERLVLDLKMGGKTTHEVSSDLGMSWEEVGKICETLRERLR